MNEQELGIAREVAEVVERSLADVDLLRRLLTKYHVDIDQRMRSDLALHVDSLDAATRRLRRCVLLRDTGMEVIR